jgi:malate dehydrogenase (oxaloacetate-decarboxylating)
LNTKEDAINFHRLLKGKIEVYNRVSVDAFYEEKGLGLIYTPGVADVATEIKKIKNRYMIIDQSGTT